MTGTSELLTGAGWVLTSAVALATIPALLAATFRQDLPVAWMLAALAPGAAAATWLPGKTLAIAPAMLLLSGLLGALQPRLPHVMATVLAVCTGAAACVAAEIHWATTLEAIGGIAALLLYAAAASGALSLARRHVRPAIVTQWALRVIGAWCFALGALLLLLGLRA